jgi:hypothetical protein
VILYVFYSQEIMTSMLSMNVGVPKLLRGEIWWLMVEQHEPNYNHE